MASSSSSAWAHGHSWRVPVEDLPWRRLPWILPVAIALWVFALWGFGRFMASPPPPQPEVPPLDAQIVEIPPPPEAPPPKPEPPVAKPPPAAPKMPAPPRPAPPIVPLEPAPPAAAPVNPLPAPAPAPPPPPAQAASSNANTNQGRSGAYAIVKPDPKIPDELTDDAVKYRASIRFNIAVDGSATVELVKPTPNPRLNQIYLDTYKTWKFFPATEDGKPVASSQTISPKINAQ